ncbi:hypothetical protein LIER_40481 [Lithospermum erythrorhizon]|uniref:Asymmetric leaves 1 n=1 Tax=Lithospermum erythrorhizon TaxID=34254 RepID=A0AAV3QWW2_LITER
MKDRQRWQPEEDSLLRAYVKQYGAKEWNLISQRMGKPLDRDPKSCLERWKNYLKPGIKKGSLTPEEQTLVISLQAKYGNKWKKIAAEVPGRTAKRLGKWWEVFKEKQLKQLQKSHRRGQDYTDPPAVSAVSGGGSPENAAQGKYDHILETFAEKYVQPKLLGFHHQAASLPLPNIIPTNISIPEAGGSGSGLPPWMNTTPTGTSSLTSSSTPSPSVSLTLSPSEQVVVDLESNIQSRVFPFQHLGSLVQYCKELEECRQNWLHHKKEATWRLNRLEQQLESEKARKKREKMEEIETRIRRLREEEMSVIGLLESEYREQLSTLQRDAEVKEGRLMEAFSNKHVELAKLVENIGVHHDHGQGLSLAPRDLF